MTHRPDRYATGPAEVAAVLVGIGAVIVWTWAISSSWPFWLTALTVLICCPLAGLGVYTALGRANRGLRLRLRYQTWPFPALVLTDTPRPSCPDCRGRGGWSEDYADAHGDYAGTTEILCACWTPWHRTLLGLPRPLATIWRRRVTGRWSAGSQDGYSEEPPF